MSRVVRVYGCSECPRRLSTRFYWRLVAFRRWHDWVCRP